MSKKKKSRRVKVKRSAGITAYSSKKDLIRRANKHNKGVRKDLVLNARRMKIERLKTSLTIKSGKRYTKMLRPVKSKTKKKKTTNKKPKRDSRGRFIKR